MSRTKTIIGRQSKRKKETKQITRKIKKSLVGLSEDNNVELEELYNEEEEIKNENSDEIEIDNPEFEDYSEDEKDTISTLNVFDSYPFTKNIKPYLIRVQIVDINEISKKPQVYIISKNKDISKGFIEFKEELKKRTEEYYSKNKKRLIEENMNFIRIRFEDKKNIKSTFSRYRQSIIISIIYDGGEITIPSSRILTEDKEIWKYLFVKYNIKKRENDDKKQKIIDEFLEIKGKKTHKKTVENYISKYRKGDL